MINLIPTKQQLFFMLAFVVRSTASGHPRSSVCRACAPSDLWLFSCTVQRTHEKGQKKDALKERLLIPTHPAHLPSFPPIRPLKPLAPQNIYYSVCNCYATCVMRKLMSFCDVRLINHVQLCCQEMYQNPIPAASP